MSDNNKTIIVDNIRLDIDCTDDDAIREATKRLGKTPESSGRIYKKSIDARHKNNIKFVYSVIFGEKGEKGEKGEEAESFDVTAVKRSEQSKKFPQSPPVVVGFGPAGMFCALVLSQNGCNPIVFETGADIDTRIKKVDNLFKHGILDEKTNVCFGEGGAGTFSDGKLTTRINDPYCKFILNQFVRFGADEKILYQAKPHVGTDKIRIITKNIREEIIKNGGNIYFNSEFTDIDNINRTEKKPDFIEITVNNSDKFKASGLFIAAGHSSFNLYNLLIKKGLPVIPKAYSVGFRIEHKQSYIDDIIYGKFAGHKNLPPAEYSLSYKKPGTRGVYTFCMCPGGVVVNSASGNGTIVTNGMSDSGRTGDNANAAVAASVLPEDYGGTVHGAFEFRKDIEKRAYNVKNKDFAAPVQTLGDYISNKTGNLKKSDIAPSYTGKVTEYDLNKIFPDFINREIKAGIGEFNKTLKGYFNENAVLTAPETRTSSAVRIPRDSAALEAVNYIGIYPCGEGSGYAGGITSSAVDGIKCAVKYMEKYRNK